MTPVADPFMAGREPPTRRPGDFYRDRFGTPHVSVADGHLVKPKRKADPPRVAMTRYSRPSNFGKIIEDMYSITKWGERQEAYGFAVAPELVERARVLIDIEDRESQAWKDEADKIVKAAKLAAKADLSADRGTHTHQLAEDDDTDRDIITRIEHGEELGLSPEVQRSLVACWREMLERDGLEILAVEMPVVNDTYRAAGTLDRVARLTRALRFRLLTGEIVELPAGTGVILDIKTGRRRLRNDGTVMYWQSYAVQVFLYGPTACPYDTETDTRGEWPWTVDGKWALIAHLDVLGAIDGKPSCDLILVDLEAGKRAADLCVAAKAWGNEDTVFSVAQIVEGEVDGLGRVISPATQADHSMTASSPSTLSPDDCNPHGIPRSSAGAPDPSAPLTVGEEAGAAAGHSPASSQGADLSAPEFELLWAKIRHEHDALPTQQREWVNKLATQARQSAVSFHTRQVQTERSYHLCKALVTLAAGGADDDILDVLMWEWVTPPHCKTLGARVGSLNCVNAERLAALSDEWASSPVPA